MLLVIVFVFFALAMLGMAVGVLVRREPLQGGCGQQCNCRRWR
jgi:hypothetical protein